MTRLSWNRYGAPGIAAFDPDHTRLGACDGPQQAMWWRGLPCDSKCKRNTPKYWAVHVSGTLTEASQPAPGAECCCKGSSFYLPETYIVEQNQVDNFAQCLYDCVPCPIIDHPDDTPDNRAGVNKFWGGGDGVLLDKVEFNLGIGLVRLYKGDAVGGFRTTDPNWSGNKVDCRQSSFDLPWIMNEAGACDWSGINVTVSPHIGTHPIYPCTWCGCRDKASEPAYFSLDLSGTPQNVSCQTCADMQKYFLLWACENARRYGPSTWQDVCQTLQGEDDCYMTPEGPACMYRTFGQVDFYRNACFHSLHVLLWSGPTSYETQPDPCGWQLVYEDDIPVSTDFDCTTISRQGTLGPLGPLCVAGCDLEGMQWVFNSIGGAQAAAQGLFKKRGSIYLPTGLATSNTSGCDSCGYDASKDPDFPQDLLKPEDPSDDT